MDDGFIHQLMDGEVFCGTDSDNKMYILKFKHIQL